MTAIDPDAQTRWRLAPNPIGSAAERRLTADVPQMIWDALWARAYREVGVVSRTRGGQAIAGTKPALLRLVGKD